MQQNYFSLSSFISWKQFSWAGMTQLKYLKILGVSKITSVSQLLLSMSKIHKESSVFLQKDWVTFPTLPPVSLLALFDSTLLLLLFLLLIPWYLHLQDAEFFCYNNAWPIVSLTLTQWCQASAALHDNFMLSKPVQPGDSYIWRSPTAPLGPTLISGAHIPCHSENTSQNILPQWCWYLLHLL